MIGPNSFRAVLVSACMAVGVLTSPAGAQPAASAVGLPNVPTTRVLAIGRLTVSPSTSALSSVMTEEVSDTVKLYLSGKIAEWFVRKDLPGVVFILDVRDAAEARALLNTLPLVRSGRMDFDLIPIGPLSPLNQLLPKP